MSKPVEFNAGDSSAPRAQYDILIKLMLLGNSSVGKTSLMGSLVNEPFVYSHLHTIGIDFKTKFIDIQGKRVKLQVWDSAGQERYETIIRPYYREAQGIVLVFDLTNRVTFDQIPKWVQNVAANKSEDEVCPLLLAGNKCDLADKRAVDRAEVDALCRAHQMTYFETSAKEGTNVEELFLSLTSAVLDQTRTDSRRGVVDTVRLESNPRTPKSTSKCC